jgi:hypothetical protein
MENYYLSFRKYQETPFLRVFSSSKNPGYYPQKMYEIIKNVPYFSTIKK